MDQNMFARLEHREHTVGDGKSSGRVARAEQHRKEADLLLLQRTGVEQGEDSADNDVPCTKFEPDISGV